MESETTPEGTPVHRIADQRTLEQAVQQHSTDRTSSSDTDPERSDPVTGAAAVLRGLVERGAKIVQTVHNVRPYEIAAPVSACLV